MSHFRPDGTTFTLDSKDIIGKGENAIVLHHQNSALKIPIQRCLAPNLPESKRKKYEFEHGATNYLIDNEKAVYARLGDHDGIAKHLRSSAEGILLVYYKNGNLKDFIKNQAEIGLEEKFPWISSLISIVAHCHTSHVLIDDLKLANIIIDDDFSLRMIDLGKCRLLPLEVEDVTKVEVESKTVKTDMLRLGYVMCAIMKWKAVDCEYFGRGSKWPEGEEFRKLEGLEAGMGEVVGRCWRGDYECL